MSTLGPLDHVARPALPWRTSADLTECGKEIARIEPARILTIEQLAARVADLGQKRAAYTTCMTCWETADRWGSRDPDPIKSVVREAEAVQHVSRYVPASLQHLKPSHRERVVRDVARRERLTADLEAIVALVAAHREEFDGYLSGRSEAVSLAERRSTRKAQVRQPRMGGTL